MRRIPLHNRDGSVRAYALVDDQDYDLINIYTWYMTSEGYVARTASLHGLKRTVWMSREVLGLAYGDGLKADHKNRNRLDNRRSNLRVVTDAQNQQNRSAEGNQTFQGSPTSSRHRGVSMYRNGMWRVQIQLDGKKYHLGYFDDEEEAGRVAIEARRQAMPSSMR